MIYVARKLQTRSLDCGHELCVMCFLEIMGMTRTFKCHMCRRYYVWKTKKAVPRKTLEVTPEEIPEETLSLLIREDESSQFKTLVGMETSRPFEVRVNEQKHYTVYYNPWKSNGCRDS